MLKGMGLLLFALFIDGLQAMISLSLFGVTAGIGVIPVIGTAIAAVAGPIGIVLGAVMSIVMSISMGGGLIAALAFNGMLYPSKLIPAFFELVPGLNGGPVWTVIVVRSMMQSYKEEHGRSFFSRKGGAATQDMSAPGGASSPRPVSHPRMRPAIAPIAPATQAPEGRNMNLKSMDGIRKPANDTMLPKRLPYVQKAA